MVDFWVSLSNNAANWVVAGSMVIQTVIFFITFKLGSQYLKQHRKKVREERRLDLIKSTKEKINFFNLTSNRIFDVPKQLTDKFEDPVYSVTSLIDGFFKEFSQKQKTERRNLEELSSIVSTNLILLKRKDLQHRWFLCHSNTVGLEVLFMSIIKEVESVNLESEKKFKFLQLPRSFTNGDHYINVQSRDLMRQIQSELTDMYHEEIKEL